MLIRFFFFFKALNKLTPARIVGSTLGDLGEDSKGVIPGRGGGDLILTDMEVIMIPFLPPKECCHLVF